MQYNGIANVKHPQTLTAATAALTLLQVDLEPDGRNMSNGGTQTYSVVVTAQLAFTPRRKREALCISHIPPLV